MISHDFIVYKSVNCLCTTYYNKNIIYSTTQKYIIDECKNMNHTKKECNTCKYCIKIDIQSYIKKYNDLIYSNDTDKEIQIDCT